jgi:hypothetical protein
MAFYFPRVRSNNLLGGTGVSVQRIAYPLSHLLWLSPACREPDDTAGKGSGTERSVVQGLHQFNSHNADTLIQPGEQVQGLNSVSEPHIQSVIPKLTVVVFPAVDNNEYKAVRLRESNVREKIGLLTKLRQFSQLIRFAGCERIFPNLNSFCLNGYRLIRRAIGHHENIDVPEWFSRKSCARYFSKVARDVRKS